MALASAASAGSYSASFAAFGALRLVASAAAFFIAFGFILAHWLHQLLLLLLASASALCCVASAFLLLLRV
jgi:hypothetical protein